VRQNRLAAADLMEKEEEAVEDESNKNETTF
jgi:hypothetical protein